MEDERIKIIIADDHRMVREGLRALLRTQPRVQVVGEADNGREAIELVRETNPHVVIMDIAMPEMNGIEATRQINARQPGVKVIGLSMHAEERTVEEMFRAGASGFLLKECAFEELASAIGAVVLNRIYQSPRLQDR